MIILDSRAPATQLQQAVDNGDVQAITRQVHQRAELPAVENVGLIWVGDSGEAPEYEGVWVTSRSSNKLVELPYWHQAVDCMIFPLICPKGQQGYRYSIRLNRVNEEQLDAQLDNYDEQVTLLL